MPPRFRPQAEPLEDRTNPAGIVFAGVLDGTLVVQGDDAGHSITLTGTGEQSVILTANDDTSINGVALGVGLALDGITRDFVVISGNGDDTVVLSNVTNKRHTALFTGTGNDTLKIVSSDLNGLTVTTGTGDDTVELTGGRVKGKVRFNGGTGTNGVFLDGTTFRASVRAFPGTDVTRGPAPMSVPEVDTTAPVAALASRSGESTADATVLFTASFSEVVSGFTQAALGVTNGTITSFTESQPGRAFLIEITPTADGAVTLALPANVATDAAGNGNTASDSVTVRSLRTDAGMTDTAPSPTDSNFVDAGTGDGLRTWDIQTGSGAAVDSATTSVQVFYTGWIADTGREFERSRTTGSPATFNPAGLITGFREGLIGMQAGGIRRFFIPSEIAYGSAGSGTNIPPDSDLIFEVKLLKVGA